MELKKRLETPIINVKDDDTKTSLKNLGIEDPQKIMEKCESHAKENEIILNKKYLYSIEETILISTYTCGEKEYPEPPYKLINNKLWNEEIREEDIDKSDYLYLLLRVLRKLSRTKKQTLYRGIKNRVTYNVGEIVVWKGFSSTSTNLGNMKQFITDFNSKKISGTLFEIRNMWGYDISDFSIYSDEQGNMLSHVSLLILILTL